jgi:hypothetical protein
MHLLTTNNCLRLLNNLLAFGKDQLNVAWIGHIWVDLQSNQYLLLLEMNWESLHDRERGMFVDVVWELG